MRKSGGEEHQSMLYSYYTLAHAMTPRRNSPTHGKSAKRNDIESGDETDRSVDNEVIETFFMDEINENTESCSLNSSRENLLDGEITNKDAKSSSRPNSRPGSARRGPYRNPELPLDERIKFLEEGLKEADMEREVVLSCLGKEYLERITMQNCLHEICAKSGYNYDELVSSIEAQSGAKNILENIIETRAKTLLESKERKTDSSTKPPGTKDTDGVSENQVNKINSVSNDGHAEVNFDKTTEDRFKEILRKLSQAEKEKLNTELKEKNGRDGNSHTGETKDTARAKEIAIGKTAVKENISLRNDEEDGSKNEKTDFVRGNQSQGESSMQPIELFKTTSKRLEKSAESHNTLKKIERPSLSEGQRVNSKGFELSGKHANLKMPEKSERITENGGNSFLRSLELKTQESSEKSLDSIDEGIFMIKTFLSGLLPENHQLGIYQQVKNIQNETSSLENLNGQPQTPRRKLSLNETRTVQGDSDLKPQRRRSYAEGMNMNRGRPMADKSSVESRLLKATVSSKNKVKGRIARRESESDTEGGRKASGRKKNMHRSVSDVQHGPKLQFYSYTSAEDDSSVDGDTMERKHVQDDAKSFQHVHDVNPELTNREYSKIMSILTMLQDQKRKWEDESKELKEKLETETKLRLDLSHDNNVLRKSLEAANHAIKEINHKVQELKLTIVPLRDENSKLREQNQGLKAKLDLLRKDKVALLQEHQELKQMKLRYEEKLQIIIDLYQNGRLNLSLDQNNNSSDQADIPKGGLPALFETNSDKTEESKPMIGSRKSNRGRDNSKRHSFHGFERIDELAGNAEELLAEKERVEKENENLKQELNDMREKIKAERVNDSQNEADSINRRRGWRMQREESKHRIIREILKTESNQVYGRPYASCTDLTLEDHEENSRKDVLKLKEMSKAGNSEESKDQTDFEKNKQKDVNERPGGISFEVKIEKKKGDISWKEESAKIEKRLASCRFENPKPNDSNSSKEAYIIGTKQSGYQKTRVGDPTKGAVNEEKTSVIKEAGIFKEKRIVNVGTGYEENESDIQQADSSLIFNQPVRNWVATSMEKENGNNEVDHIQFVSKIDRTSSRENESTLHSPQWPLVREKIQGIYKQPVEILEQSLQERDLRNKQNSPLETPIVQNEAKFESMEAADVTQEEHYRRNVMSREMQKDHMNSYDDSIDGEFEYSYTSDYSREGKNDALNVNGERKSDYNWQRKSSNQEIQSYDDYRRKLRQKELEQAYSSSFCSEQNTETPLKAGAKQANDWDSQSSNRKGQQKFERNGDTESFENSHRTPENVQKMMQGEFLVNGCNEQKGGLAWVNVPVYLKDANGRDIGGQSMTPTGTFKRIENEGESRMRGGSKMIEETITKVESAFSATKAFPQKVSSRKGNEKSSTSKNINEFVRRSPGTVMYLDELADSDSDSSYEPPPPRRTRSYRKPRPKSDIFPNKRIGDDVLEIDNNSQSVGSFRRNRSLRLPRRTKDDMFSVDISFENESQDDSAVMMHTGPMYSTPEYPGFLQSTQMQSESMYSSDSHTRADQLNCKHHQPQGSPGSAFSRPRIQSETGTTTTRSSIRRAKSPGGFSCEMCKEMSKKRAAQERYCWEKYFPIGETTIETRVIKEDYV